MGGYGSGQRFSKKPVVEGRLAIDTADLRRMNLLAPGTTCRSGSLHWYRGEDREPTSSLGYTLTLDGATGTFWLRYQTGQPAESVGYPVGLVTTGCHLGGVRWWFLCPLACNGVACGRRVRKLYLCGKYFGCRDCHGLTYTSTQESDRRVYALLRGGLDVGTGDGPLGMSPTQLCLTMKALTLEQRRLDRLDRRCRRGHRRPRAGPEKT